MGSGYRQFVGKKCERCGFDKSPLAIIGHHKDENRSHNVRENIETLCYNCHIIHHRSIPKNKLFDRLYTRGSFTWSKDWSKENPIDDYMLVYDDTKPLSNAMKLLVEDIPNFKLIQNSEKSFKGFKCSKKFLQDFFDYHYKDGIYHEDKKTFGSIIVD